MESNICSLESCKFTSFKSKIQRGDGKIIPYANTKEIIQRMCFSRRKENDKEKDNDIVESSHLSPEFIRKKLKTQMDEYGPITMPDETMERIFKKIPEHLFQKLTPNCDFLLDEMRNEYGKSSKEILLDMTAGKETYRTLGKELKIRCQKSPFGLKEMQDTKKLLEGNIFHYFPFIRRLIAEAQRLLPAVFIDCSKYSGFKGFYHPEILLSLMEKEIDREDLRMEFDWFGKLFMHVSEKEFFLDWKENKVSRFITLIIQITRSIALDRIYDTLEAVVAFLTNPKTTPKIAVQVYYSFDGRIVIIPTAEEIYSNYCNLIKRVYDMGKNFTHFEMFHLKKGRRGLISLEKYDNIKNIYECKIKGFVIDVYKNMTEYYNEISKRYVELTDDRQTSNEKLSAKTMEELIAMADHYINIKSDINEIEVNKYFPHFKANNKALVKSLLFITECRIDQIMNEVLKFHVEYCERNCCEFSNISQKGMKVPETTEELISLASFMQFVSKDHLANLREGILSYLELFYRVMEIVTVSQTYLDMMGLVLGWVTYMESVIRQNSSMLEISKNEFEERLNKVTEKLNEDLENFSSDELDGLDHLDDYTMINSYTLHIMKCLRKVQQFDDTAKWINKEESLFEMSLSTYPELDEIKAFVNPFAKLIFQLYNWNMVYQTIMDGSLENLTLETVEATLEEYNNLVDQLLKWFKSKIKQQTNENNPRCFKGKVDDSEYENWPAPIKLLHGAQKNIDEIKDHKHYIKLFCNPNMTSKHWESISKIAGRDMTPYKGASLRQFINFKVDDKMDLFEAISESATKEHLLKESLINMWEEWKNVHFVLKKSDKTSVILLDSIDHIQSLIDNHLVKTLSIRSSSYVKPIEDDLKQWYTKLQLLSITLEELFRVQSKWIYFLPIFSSDVIADQMKVEGKLFKEVNTSYIELIQLVKRNTLVMSIISYEQVLPSLKLSLMKFEKINVGVQKYIEKKRLFFPRLFFLSDKQMFSFLSETKDPKRTPIFLKKCFSGISFLGFDDLLNINSIISSQYEEIKLSSKVSVIEANCSAEKWLAQIEDQMIISIRSIMKKSIDGFKVQKHHSWMCSWPGQIILCVSQLYWTYSTHDCFNSQQSDALLNYYHLILNQIKDTISSLHKNLTSSQRVTFTSLVVVDVHCKDVIYNLSKHSVSSSSDFLWLSQLRYYWEDDIKVRVLNALVKYSYEYLGNNPRLIITPLTERCQRTLIEAYTLHYFGAPHGPSSTGKTQTIKDLAEAVAVYCHLFNCSFSADIETFGKFFKGIASSGAWMCFHEFDKINAEDLSVIAEQMLCITQAIRQSMPTFMFSGSSLTLNPSCFICITINPGYVRRSELPSNLKALFRPVAMIVPDYSLIGEVYLLSNGFENPKVLANKIITIFQLCFEILPHYTHYDFGLRAIKSILKTTTMLKMESPGLGEDLIVMKAILQNSLPKIPENHKSIFTDIICDTFPSAKEDLISSKGLTSDIIEVCSRRNLQALDGFVCKVKQAKEIMKINHSVIFFGEPFSGKSTVLKVLFDLHQTIRQKDSENLELLMHVINPKAVSFEQLNGFFDEFHKWNDGLFGKIFRELTELDDHKLSWVVFDGPIDSIWVECLNTALDNNKILCLNNGEIIEITANTTIIFETTDLLEACPATLSRCGMLHFESKVGSWNAIVKSWNESLPREWKEDNPDRFILLLEWLIPPCINFISKHCANKIFLGIEHLSRSICYLIEMMLREASEGQDLKHINVWSQAVVLNSVLWCINGSLDKNSREKFDCYIRKLWQNEEEEKYTHEEIEVILPTEGLIEDNSFVYKAKGSWKYWPDVFRMMKHDDIYNTKINLVTTVDSLKYSTILELFIKHKRPFLLSGLPGVGKTSLIHNLLLMSVNECVSPSFISLTTSAAVQYYQEIILSKLIKRSKGIYGPSGNNKSIIFIDDVHMVQGENNSPASLELLRQFCDYGYWYDTKSLEKIFLHDLIFVSAMSLQHEYNYLSSIRFLRHFVLFRINPFSEDMLTKIFTTIVFMGLRKNGFPADIMSTTQQVVVSTLTVYYDIVHNLLPTPQKCHYIFGIRDLVRIFQGFLLARKETVDGKKTFIRLWVHEVFRVFHDRLIDQSDRDWVFGKMRTVVEEVYKEEFDSMLDGLGENEGSLVVQEDMSNLIFTTAFDTDTQEKYEEITSIDSFCTLASKMLDEFNAKNKHSLRLILFKYALEHLSRICRIMSIQNGNGLLIGIIGTGRQSLVKLAAYMLQQTVYQPETSNNFEFSNWRNYMKIILKESGAENKQCVLLLNETQMKVNYIVEDIDAFLNTGEIFNLYAINEMQDIVEIVRADFHGDGTSDINHFSIVDHFFRSCKKNLHVFMCMSAIYSDIRTILRKFPSIVQNCTIDWFESEWILNANGRLLNTTGWPEEALEQVANEYLADVDLNEPLKTQIINICKYFHVCARDILNKLNGRKTYISSASYLHLLELYRFWYEKKKEEVELSKGRYLGGLKKLEFAACQVEIMQKDLESLQPALKKAAEETSQMLKVIETETFEVEKASERVRLDEEIANEQAMAAMELKTECENDLALAIPILEDAVAALNTLKPADITLVKSMKNPPETVKLVLAAVCVMRGMKPDRLPDPKNPGRKINDYWGPSKRLLGDMSFLQQLKDYDKDNIPANTMKAVRAQYLNHKDFKPKVVAKASSAAEGLCKWVIALDKYDVVVKEVSPKKEKLRIAEKEYSETMAILEEKRNLLKGLEDKLAELKDNLKEANERKIRLQNEVVLCSNKLQKAQRIIGSLGGEKNRWEEVAEDLKKQFDEITGNILLSCSVIAYLSSFTPELRKSTIANWVEFSLEMKIPLSSEYSLSKALGSSGAIEQWSLCGLPNDSFSIDNAIILHSSRRWPLLIDPQNQANKWIKNIEEKNGLKVIRSMKNSEHIIKFCIETGKPILLENFEKDFDSLLKLISNKHSEGSRFFCVEGCAVSVHENFHFYITTTLCDIDYPLNFHNIVTVINFSLTVSGLADQLLEIVIAKERSELQEKRQVLLLESSKNKTDLQAVEDGILKTLSSVTGNILEDERAVNSLDTSKAIAEEIKMRETTIMKTRDDIERFRLGYQPVGLHCATLFYTLTHLSLLDPMYQYSLNWFFKIFAKSIDIASKSNTIQERIQNLKEMFNYSLYVHVSYTLFQKHKLLYSFILCQTVLIMERKLNPSEIDLLYIRFTEEAHIELINPVKEWLPDKIWIEICRISLKPSFQNFHERFMEDIDAWKAVYFTSNITSEDVPLPWFQALTSFEKIVLITVIRPDRFLSEVSSFIKNKIGEKFLSSPKYDIKKAFDESDNTIPLIFISLPGIDPMQSLLSFVKRERKESKFVSISLGKNQDQITSKAIEDAKKVGNWICLQNCHLSLYWMPKLEQLIESLSSPNVSTEFRLYLTTNSSGYFPISILQKGVKIINEEPKDLKENLYLRYCSEPTCDVAFYESCPRKETLFTRLLYALTFFHGIVCERKRFGPVGWSISYSFDETDYLTSIYQLQKFVNDFEDSTVEAMLYLLGECNYGGKVVHQWDKRILNILLKQFINKEIITSDQYLFIKSDYRYSLPVRNDYKHFIRCIENLPSVSSPEIHGLHMNASWLYDLEQSIHLMNRLYTIYSGPKPEKQEDKLLQNAVENILSKIPDPFDLEEVAHKYPKSYSNSMNMMLVHEIKKCNEIIIIMHQTTSNLLKVFKGYLTLTPNFEKIMDSLAKGEVPKVWSDISYPSLKSLGSYITDFIERNKFLQEWFNSGVLMDYWISGLCYPKAFLTGLILNYARQNNIIINSIELDCDFLDHDRAVSYPESGVTVYGLYLDGAHWNRQGHYLEEEYPMMQFDKLPALSIIPCLKEDQHDEGLYHCPLYITPARNGQFSTNGTSKNYIRAVSLKSREPFEHWVKRGVAMLCQTFD